MGNMIGFTTINVYALVLILFVCGVFYSKKRLHNTEDNTYSYLLMATILTTISGIILGILVSPEYSFSEILIIIANKIYLACLSAWTLILTFYTFYISRIKEGRPVKQIKRFFAFGIAITFLIFALPLDTKVENDIAIATGASIMFNYTAIGLEFITMFILLVLDHKNLKNRKYIPIYALAILGSLVLIIQIFTNLNYLINPSLVLIVIFMYFTIENPDMQMVETLLRNQELVERTVTDKSNFLFKVSQEIKKPINNIINSIKTYENLTNEEDKNKIIESISQDANNVNFIVNDITDLSSTDFKKLKIQNTPYITKKLLIDIESNASNQLKIQNKDKNIMLNMQTLDTYPEKLSGDYVRIKQIILSTIFNSIKETKEGFIDVELDTISRYDICRLIFTIKDSSKGMSISKINKLLSSNEEFDLSEFEKIDSLNLDYPIVIKMIKALGGSISIRSEEGKGTIVVIVLDQEIVSSNQEKAIKDAKIYQANLKANKRVLIADDSESLEKLGRLFTKYDYDTILTISGKDVVDKILSGDKYDLIVLKDEMKPDSGFDILKKLKEIDKFNTPVLITIKKDKEFIKNHFIEDGFKDVLLEDKIDEEVKRFCEEVS